MKKEMIGIVIAGLIGTCPLSTYAANDNLYVQLGKSVSIISVDRKQDHDQKREKGKEKEEERREQERREQGRRDQERKKEEARLEQERRERERREQEHREEERRGHGHDRGHENERREQERRREEQRRAQERNDASYIIHRTADVVFVAQRATGRRHYYRGLSLAIAHQQKARRLYMAGFYQDAIFHSLRAREIAIVIIRENRENWSGSWDDREERYRCNAPRDNDLDIKLNLIKIGDKEAVRISVDLDL